MGALLGGPRTLQALAQDRVMPRLLARTFGASKEPRLATAMTFWISRSIGPAGLGFSVPYLERAVRSPTARC